MRLRVRFTKKDSSRYLSHLELMTAMERTFRRAAIPLAFSQGFNPHPKISFASALSVGIASESEYLDVILSEFMEPKHFVLTVNEKSIPGIRVLDVQEIDLNSKSLTAMVERAKYKVKVKVKDNINLTDFKKKYDEFLRRQQIVVLRKTKRGIREVNIKDGIFNMEYNIIKDVMELRFLVCSGSKGNVRPQEVLEAFVGFAGLALSDNPAYIREEIYNVRDGKMYDLMGVLEG